MKQLSQCIAIAIIGGADGPTSIYIAPDNWGAVAFLVLLIAAFFGLFAFVVYKLIKSIKSQNKAKTIIFAVLTSIFTIMVCVSAGFGIAEYLWERQLKKSMADTTSGYAEPQFEIESFENEETELLSNQKAFYKEDFPSDEKWNGKNVAPVLDTETKKNYKTVITEASRLPPDFNGKYKIAQYGAGTMANGFFIINLETGIVTEGFTFELALDYSIDSKLIIRNPKAAVLDFWHDELEAGREIPGWCITEYYLFEDDTLTMLKD